MDVVKEETTAVAVLSSSSSPALPQKRAFEVWDLPKVFWKIVGYLTGRIEDLISLLLVNHRFHVLTTHDHIWRDVLAQYNLQALVARISEGAATTTTTASSPSGTPSGLSTSPSLYRYFIDDIVTTKALHGRYDFEAHSAGGISDRFSPYNITSAVLIVSSATLGNAWHGMGRGQLMITFRGGAVEILQGCLRFSGVRRCFMFCSCTFGSTNRGPVLTIAVAQVKRKWANQSAASYSVHAGGTRLVMTPVLHEGKTKGGLLSETDVIAVGRPPPPGQAPPAGPAAPLAPAPTATRIAPSSTSLHRMRGALDF